MLSTRYNAIFWPQGGVRVARFRLRGGVRVARSPAESGLKTPCLILHLSFENHLFSKYGTLIHIYKIRSLFLFHMDLLYTFYEFSRLTDLRNCKLEYFKGC